MKTPVVARTAAALVLALSLAPASARAAISAPRVPAAVKLDLSAWLPALRHLWVRVWNGEGMSIDPNGQGPVVPAAPHAAPAPLGGGLDEGASIDPNGGH